MTDFDFAKELPGVVFALESSGRISFLQDEVIIRRTNPTTAKVLVIRFIKNKLIG